MSYKDRLITLGLLPLSYRREIANLTFFYKCMNGSYDAEINKFIKRVSYSGNLRSVANGLVFRHNVCRTETYQSSFFNRTVDLWNGLLSNVRTCTTLESFKRRLISRTITKIS